MAKKKTTRRKASPKKAAAKKATPKPNGKLSALDAAAKVLAASKKPMNANELIESMAARNSGCRRAARRPTERSMPPLPAKL